MPKPPLKPLAVSPDEAARLMGVSRAYVYKLFDAGELVRRADGRRRLVLVADIEARLANLKLVPPRVARDSTEPLLPDDIQRSVIERACEPGGPDFNRIFVERLQSLSPSLGEDEARTRALTHTIRAYRRHHECNYKTASAAVRALIDPPAAPEPAGWERE